MNLSELNLQDDFEKVLALPDADRWKLGKPGPLEVWANMCSADKLDDLFQARLIWSAYPDQPPSLKFRDPNTGRLDQPSAWPNLPGFRPTSLDACVSWCIEGFNLHPEWKNDVRYRWDSRGNVLLKVLRILQGQLDEHFGGRYK